MEPKNEPMIEVIPADPEMVRKEIESEHRRTEIRSELLELNQKQTELIHNLNLLGKLKRELENKIASVSLEQEENEKRIRQLENELLKSHDHSNDKDDKTRAAGLKKTANTLNYVKNLMYYEAPDHSEEKNVIVMLPLENGEEIPLAMYVQLITKVPEGKITTWEDINAFLGKMYEKDVPSYTIPSLPRTDIYDITINPLTRLPIVAARRRRVAGYARVSTDHDEQFTSYEAQVDYYTNYIKSNPEWEFVKVYTERNER